MKYCPTCKSMDHASTDTLCGHIRPADGTGPAGFAVLCGGQLLTISCLVCMDQGQVTITDPTSQAGHSKRPCPRGCGRKA